MTLGTDQGSRSHNRRGRSWEHGPWSASGTCTFFRFKTRNIAAYRRNWLKQNSTFEEQNYPSCGSLLVAQSHLYQPLIKIVQKPKFNNFIYLKLFVPTKIILMANWISDYVFSPLLMLTKKILKTAFQYIACKLRYS